MNQTIKLLSIAIIFAMISSVSARESGLLLGLRYGANYDVSATLAGKKTLEPTQGSSSYRTFLLQANAEKGQIELVAERTNLLLPRDDGFWRIDVKHSHYNDYTEDFIWINPASDPDSLPNPFLAEQEGINAFDISLLVKEDGIESPHGEYCTGHVSRDILFMNDNHLSVGYIRNDVCQGFLMENSSDSALQMLSLQKLSSLKITTMLDDNGQKIFNNAAKEYKTTNTVIENWGDISGGIIRGSGQWIVKGHLPIDDGKYTHFDVPIATPKSLVAKNALYPDWEVIKQHIPDAIDAFSSPAKNLLIVLTDSGSLLGFTVKQGKISQQPALHIILKYPLTAVMAFWASGQYVENWIEEIENLGPIPTQSWFAKAEVARAKKKTDKITGVIVTANMTLNIRQGIGRHTKPIAKANKGSKVKVLDILGQWYKVQLDSDKVGYAHSDNVKILPQLPYIQAACPVDNCIYGKWRLKKPAVLYVDSSFNADVLATLAAQQSLLTLQGEVHTTQFGEIEVIKAKLELTDGDQKLFFHEGDKIFDLEPVGLNMHVVWYNGELYYLNNGWDSKVVGEDALWGTMLIKRKTDWWIKVEIPAKKLTGWIANPDLVKMD